MRSSKDEETSSERVYYTDVADFAAREGVYSLGIEQTIPTAQWLEVHCWESRDKLSFEFVRIERLCLQQTDRS